MATKPCTQDVDAKLPNGDTIVIRKNSCVEPPTYEISTENETTETSTTTAAETTEQSTTTEAETTEPSTTTESSEAETESCTEDVWAQLDNGDFVVVRKNTCKTPIAQVQNTKPTTTKPVAVVDYVQGSTNRPALSSLTDSTSVDELSADSDKDSSPVLIREECIERSYETLPDGKIVFVKKIVC